MILQYKPDLSHVRIFGSQVNAWLPPQEREANLTDMTRDGRYVEYSESDCLWIILDENSNHLFHRSRTWVFKDIDLTAERVSVEPPAGVDDDSFI